MISCSHTPLGLRWIFEALAGGDLSGIDPEWFVNKNSEKPEEQLPAVKQELARIIEKLQNEVHVVVGHNLFTDLGFLYKTFIGALSANVKHFQEDIHDLFPVVIDTKYLATHGADSMNPRANLKELLAPFRKTHVCLFSSFCPPSECLAARGTSKFPPLPCLQSHDTLKFWSTTDSEILQVPLIVLHEQHTAYGASFGKEHEAGFDSWMTAELFVKLTAKLYTASSPSSRSSTELAYISSSSEEDSDSSPSGGAPINPPSSSPSKPTSTTNGKSKPHSPFNLTTMQDNLPPPWHAAQLNPYAVLQADNDEEAAALAEEPKPKQWIPGMDNAFWDVYANKLRVNAIEGGVCDLEEGAEG